MDADDRRNAAKPRTVAGGGDTYHNTIDGPKHGVLSRHLGSSMFTFTPSSARAHLLPPPLVGQHSMVPGSALSSSAVSEYRSMVGRPVEHTVRRVIASPDRERQQTDLYVPPPPKRPRYYPIRSPPPARSTSWTEFSPTPPTLASSFLHPHRYLSSYRPLSVATPAAPSSLPLPFWPDCLSPVRSALDQVVDCVGAIRPPPPVATNTYPGQTMPLHPVQVRRQPRQLVSMPGSDRPLCDAAVTNQCTRATHGSSSSSSAGSGGIQLHQDKQSSSVSSPHHCRRQSHPVPHRCSPSPRSCHVQSLPPVSRTLEPALSSPRRTRFSRGSVIELGGGRWKRVEQLSDEDFEASAVMSTNKRLELITVRHILHKHDRNSIVIDFHLDEYQTQMTVEAARDHPFFVRSKGWCSCCPQRTLDRYGLACRNLLVGDSCFSLCRFEPSKFHQPSSSAVASSSAECRKLSETGEEQLDVPLDYSKAST